MKRLREHAHELRKGADAAIEASSLTEEQKAVASGVLGPLMGWLSRYSDIVDPIGSKCAGNARTRQPGALRGRHGERVE